MAEAPLSSDRVLLGFIDAVLEDEASSWVMSKIGGLPDSPPHVTLRLPSCSLCSATLCHVAQVYCPLEGSPYHRVIHVFACSTKTCWGKRESWVAIRSQSLEGHEPQIKDTSVQQVENLAAKDWCDDADDWGCDVTGPLGEISSSSFTSQAKSCPTVFPQIDCASRLQNLSLDDGLGSAQSRGPVFHSYYVAVADEEDCTWSGDLDHAQQLLHEYEKREGLTLDDTDSPTGKGESEKYEKSDLKSQDLVFHKFLKKISSCRQQILRYSWNGTPLYMSSPALGSQPAPCAQCGSRRVFEFQLMPALVSMLYCAGAEVTLEFGTVLVFTCEKSCWSAGSGVPVQEYCFVQEDPDQKFFH